MKTDAERQTAYQKRRAETEARVVLWVPKETCVAVDVARGAESRSEWIRLAIADSLAAEELRFISLAELR